MEQPVTVYVTILALSISVGEKGSPAKGRPQLNISPTRSINYEPEELCYINSLSTFYAIQTTKQWKGE